MTDIINLRQHRKAKERTEKDQKAAANRAKFGRTKAEKKRESQEADRAERHIEGHKRITDDEEE